MSWSTANTAVLAEGRRVLLDDPTRFDGVRVIGVDEHVWRHTRRGDKFVTVVIDLTPVRDETGPPRLLAMVEGRSKQAFTTWLASRPQVWRDGLEVVEGVGCCHAERMRHRMVAPRVTGVSKRQATLHRWALLNRPRQEPWRARCGESRTPGSASGLGKRTSSNAGTAPQADSTLAGAFVAPG